MNIRPDQFQGQLPVLPEDAPARWQSALIDQMQIEALPGFKTINASIVFTAGSRAYSDEQEISFECASNFCHLSLHMRTAGAEHRVSDGTADLEAVPRLISNMVDELRERAATETTSLPRRLVPCVVLAPTVAAVLLHELIGHVAEDLSTSEPRVRVGPDNFNVLATHPRGAGFDDEGVAIKTVPLVSDGWCTGPVFDSMSYELKSPSGLAQAAWHCGPPRARCTHLRVAPGELNSKLLSGISEAILCTGIHGAELIGHHAMLGISASELLRNGRPERRLKPFYLGMSLPDLARQLVSVGDDLQISRIGMCVKGDQALPTFVQSPTIVLEEPTLYAR